MLQYERLLSRALQNTKPSGIRRFFDIAHEMKDVITLSIGEPDFSTPWHIREKGIESLQRGKTWYSPNAGLMELRRATARYLNRRFSLNYDPKTDILMTVGGSEAIDLCLRALLNPGDEVLIPSPSFVCYEPLTAMTGAKPVIIPTDADHAFRLTAQAISDAITPKTKLLILPYPNNPTGAIMRREHLETIAQVLRQTDILVLSDEIYGELTYGDEGHCSFPQIAGMQERTLLVSGFSKAYAMTGWRLGYVCGPTPIMEQVIKLHQFAIMCAPTTAQYAAIEALDYGDEDIAHMREEYNRRRRLIVSELNGMGLTCFDPQGAFYAFPSIQSTGLNSEEFCMDLLREQRVAVVPGTAFGDCGEGFVRISYCYSIDHIVEAMKRMRVFLRSRSR